MKLLYQALAPEKVPKRCQEELKKFSLSIVDVDEFSSNLNAKMELVFGGKTFEISLSRACIHLLDDESCVGNDLKNFPALYVFSRLHCKKDFELYYRMFCAEQKAHVNANRFANVDQQNQLRRLAGV